MRVTVNITRRPEIADPQGTTVQRALVHPEAASVRELLCHAQYLKAVGLQVSARIVPIVAGLHDSSGGFMPLVRAIAAADICDVSLRVGALSQGAMDALARSMDAALALCVARAYQTQDAEAENSRKDSRGALWQLRAKTSRALEEGLLGLAREAGMHVYGCDCGQQCDLHRAVSPSPIARTLFASIDSPVASLRPERSEELSGAGAFFESGLASRDVVLAGHRRRQNRKASNEDHGQGFTAHQLALLGT